MAKHAHTTSPLFGSTAGALPPLLPAGSGRQPGPVTLAIRAMRIGDLDAEQNAKLRSLRSAIDDRTEADLALLAALDGDPDLELSLGAVEPYSWRGRQRWAGGGSDDRESAQCVDCDGEAVPFFPIVLRRCA